MFLLVLAVLGVKPPINVVLVGDRVLDRGCLPDQLEELADHRGFHLYYGRCAAFVADSVPEGLYNILLCQVRDLLQLQLESMNEVTELLAFPHLDVLEVLLQFVLIPGGGETIDEDLDERVLAIDGPGRPVSEPCLGVALYKTGKIFSMS